MLRKDEDYGKASLVGIKSGRPKTRSMDTLKDNMKELGLRVEDVKKSEEMERNNRKRIG